MKKSILLIVLSLFLWACPSDIGSESLCIVNNSEKEMFFWFSKNYTIHHYPDTLLPPTNPMLSTPYSEVRGAGTGGCVGNNVGHTISWRRVFNELPADKFTVYFFETYPETQEEWDELLENEQEKVYRKDVTYEELQATDFHIYYP